MNKNDEDEVGNITRNLLHVSNTFDVKYKYYEDRIKTFSTWPKAHPIKPDKLCSSGFVYTGLADKVYCFCCSTVLLQFESNDNPFIEHLKFSRDCEFLKIVLAPTKV